MKRIRAHKSGYIAFFQIVALLLLLIPIAHKLFALLAEYPDISVAPLLVFSALALLAVRLMVIIYKSNS